MLQSIFIVQIIKMQGRFGGQEIILLFLRDPSKSDNREEEIVLESGGTCV